MLELVPLAGPRRQVTDGHRQAARVSELLQLDLPQADPIAVAAPAIGADEQPLGPLIGAHPHGLPPAAEASDREGGRVMVPTDRVTQPALRPTS